MHDARRGPTSMLAYSEFLEGMALISQQEYLSPDHTGENANSFQDEMLNAMPTKERKQKLKKLATWERTIRQRNQAQTTATFAKNLERRVHMDRGTPVEKCSKGHLPIRGETRDILIRPLEADFSAFGAIMYLVSIGICVFNIYIQITTIRGVCSAAFTCPRAETCGLPAVAPPIAFRSAGTLAITGRLTFVSVTRPWNPRLVESCSYGDANCQNPGYSVQWPYLQKSDGSVGIATAVKKTCTLRNDGNWFVWDPMTESLRDEYYDCPDEILPFQETWTKVDGNLTYDLTAAFHLDSQYYKKIREATDTCLNLVIKNDGPELNITKLSDFRTLTGSNAAVALAKFRDCLVVKRPEYTSLTKCDCGLFKWSAFPVSTFYSGPEETKTCVGGEFQGTLCSDAAVDSSTKCGNGTCTKRFPEQHPLNSSSSFGCFFKAPDAAAQMSPVYSTCGESVWASFSGLSHDKQPGGLQKAAMIDLSKRTILIFIFLFKELGVVTATVMTIALVIVFRVLVLALMLIFSLPVYLVWHVALYLVPDASGKLERVYWGGQVVGLIPAVQGQFKVVYAMFKNLSTINHVWNLCMSIYHGLVNPSIKDMDTKLPTVANLVYNLVLLITLAEYSPCLAPGTTTNTDQLVASLVLSLSQLLYQMNSEHAKLLGIQRPLEDLNENRLTKFEFVLLITKIMEDFLDSDVQYNFVEHFRSTEPLLPKVDDLDAEENKRAYEKADHYAIPCLDPYSNVKNRIMKVIHVGEDDLNTIFYMPRLEVVDAKEFGHDGLGHYSGDYGDIPKGVQQAVFKDGGQVKLKVSEEHQLTLDQLDGAPNAGSVIELMKLDLPPLARSAGLIGTAVGKVTTSVWDKKMFYGCSPLQNGEGPAAVVSNQVTSMKYYTSNDNSGGDYADPRNVTVDVTGRDQSAGDSAAPSAVLGWRAVRRAVHTSSHAHSGDTSYTGLYSQTDAEHAFGTA